MLKKKNCFLLVEEKKGKGYKDEKRGFCDCIG